MALELSIEHIGWIFVILVHCLCGFVIIKSWNKDDHNTSVDEFTRRGSIWMSMIVLGIIWIIVMIAKGWMVFV